MVFFDPSGRRKFLLGVAGLVLVLALPIALISGFFYATTAVTYARAPDAHPLWDHPDLEKALVLTFDDGPDPEYTPRLLEVLEEHDVPATFFLLGENVVRHPRLARSIADKGFELGNHTFTHSREVHASPERMRAEIIAADRAIAAVTGKTTVFYRPPFLLDIDLGEVDGSLVVNENLRHIESFGLMTVGADTDPWDWAYSSPADAHAIHNRLVAEVKEGGRVILLHDHGGNGATVEALRTFIPAMKAEGYRFVPVSALYGLSPEQAMPPAPAASLAHYALVGFLFTGVGGGSVLHVLMTLAIAFTLARVMVMVVARRIAVPFFSKGKHQLPPEKFSKRPVTALIPAYNEAANIEATIRSVMAGSVVPTQTIVIDDGSTDETPRIVERLMKEYDSLRLLSKKNDGSKASALRLGFAHARHEIVLCIDADTTLDKDALGHLLPHFNDPKVGAVAGKVYSASMRTLVEKFQCIEYLQGQNIDKEVFALVGAVGIVPGAIGAWRRSAVEAAGGYSTNTVVEDQDLTLAILAGGWLVNFERRSRAYTEAPASVRGFFKQRFRWVYGTLQCFRKYEHWLGSTSRPWLGFVILPNIVFFNIVFPLFVPFMDAVLLFALFRSVDVAPTFIFFLLLLLFDFWYAREALIHEKKPPFVLLWYLPLQRWFYRYAMALAIGKSIFVALKGGFVAWSAHQRLGTAQRAWNAAQSLVAAKAPIG